jgi:hypothetical protein
MIPGTTRDLTVPDFLLFHLLQNACHPLSRDMINSSDSESQSLLQGQSQSSGLSVQLFIS